jgi:hypothetical protein
MNLPESNANGFWHEAGKRDPRSQSRARRRNRQIREIPCGLSPKLNGVNSTSLSGRFLAHNHAGPIPRAFLAAELISGAKYLTAPTLIQAAALARVNRTYVQWALKHQAERAEIEAGRIPLIPPQGQFVVPKTNGTTLPAMPEIDDAGLVQLVRSVGVDRMFEAVVAADAAQ